MSIRRAIDKETGIYFITITCHKWIPLFEIANAYIAVFDWFDALKREGNQIAAYVIMPNHLHALIHFTNISKSVNQYVSNGKRFMAYDIVKRLKEKNQQNILKELEKGVNNTQKNIEKKHEVFKPSFDCKKCEPNETGIYPVTLLADIESFSFI